MLFRQRSVSLVFHSGLYHKIWGGVPTKGQVAKCLAQANYNNHWL
ncbi:hypothetical protein SLEP1_g10628 [Rubroshorea leprosula]|uniref:Uncharacterized protein n=1 Tax=Rubroshorea leprosula TaxID=152421 RepID=A0AAV5IEE5_9ROSI|nr:hypothetical protein SLEP1_g10628 [Rubroshorea leprosula]